MNDSSTDKDQAKPTKQLGKAMIIVSWLLIFAMLVWFFGVLEKGKHNPNQNVSTQVLSSGEKQVTLKSGSYGHYIASGMINDTKVTFLVDTGASYVSIPERVAKKIGLRKGAEMRVTTANGTVSVYATILDEVSIGEIKRNNIKADINPHMDGDEILLGMSFLRDLSITHQGDELTIRQ